MAMATDLDQHPHQDQDQDQDLGLGLDPKVHTAFFLRHLHLMPTPYGEEDSSRMTLGMFVLGALDVLGTLPARVPPNELAGLADWVYAQQVPSGGFRGSPGSGPCPAAPAGAAAGAGAVAADPLARGGNVVMTYSALNVLSILRDSYTRLDRAGIASLLRACQQPDGSFVVAAGTVEADVRYAYAAFAVAYHLDLWAAIDVPRTLAYFKQCRTYDHAFSQAPGQESHGGSTYCVVAALALCGALRAWQTDGTLDARLARWLLGRQVFSAAEAHVGFSGRRGKDPDVCYSFWCGAALALLGHHAWIGPADAAWILACQSAYGGIAKVPDHHPDVMHAYLGLAALAMHAHDSDLAHTRHSAPRLQTQADSGGADADPDANASAHAHAHAQGTHGLRALPLQPINPALNLSLSSAQWAHEHLDSRPWTRQD